MEWSRHWDALVLAVAPGVIVFVLLKALWRIEDNAESEKVVARLISGKGLAPPPEGPERQAPVAPPPLETRQGVRRQTPRRRGPGKP